MFEEVVRRPLSQELPDLWQNRSNSDVLDSVQKNVLKYGSTDFDSPYRGDSPLNGATVCYSPAQKVLLYCAVNMPMHLYSSYHVYQRHLEPPEGKVLFIDFGCGPLTSGIAYHAFAKKHANVSYIGIDRSRAMLDMVRSIYDASLFNRCMPLDNFSSLPHCIDKFIMDNQTIIFNFCYILAIRTLGDSQNLNRLTNALLPILKRYKKHPMRVVYQNPEGLNRNWKRLKSRLMQYGFRPSGLNVEQFSFPRLTDGSLRSPSVECETLYKPPV